MVLKLLAGASVIWCQSCESTETFEEIHEIEFTAFSWERSGNVQE